MKRKKVGPAKASNQTRVKKARIGEDVGNQPSTSESSSNSVVISMHHSDTDEDQQDSNNQRSILTLNRSRTDTVPINPEERMRNQIPRQHYESSSSDSKGHVPEISHSTKITAMASLDESLKDPEFANWVKSCMALNITNEVLRPFVVKEITKFQSIVKTLSQKSIRKEIKKIHWYPYPSFENTSQRSWRTEPWEIAKCFMSPYQVYKHSTASDADFSACISVIINCKRFQAFGTSDPREKGKKNDHSKSRDFRNEVMHSISQKVTETYMKENLDTLISIINNLQTAETKMAIEKIQKIKTNQLKIKLEDVIEAKKNAIEANVDNSKKDKDQVQRERLLVNFEAGCRKALCRLTEDLISKQKGNDNKTKSVEAFLSNLSMFAERKNLCSLHQEMLFPETGTPTDIGQWDMFVYCFILEDIGLYESPENAVSNFVKAVKEIRDKLLLYATEVTQDDLSKLYEYKIDTDLKTEITEIFNKDASHFTNADVIRSYNTLKSWWRDEEEYGKKPAPRKQLNHKRQLIQKVKSTYETVDNMFQGLLATLGYRGGRESLYRDVEPRMKCNLEPCECSKKTKEAIEKDFTSSNNKDLQKCIDEFRHQRDLLEVNPEEGCIILNVKCSSITNLLDFWDSCIDGRAVEALSKVRDYYRRYFKCDTLEFDVILTRKGVSSCVNEIVEGLQPHVQEMIDKVTDKVHEILKAKEKTQLKEIDFRAEGERIMKGKRVKAMASIDIYLKDPEYKNWVKSGLALNITNEVLRPFVVKEITKLHQSIVKTLPRGVSCTGCSVNTACPYGICDEIQREIENKYWYFKPSFTNTHTRRWSADPWEIAKCYMSPSKRCKRSSASDADFSACISVIINCKHFQAFGTSDPYITETVYFKSRDFWNRLMYASPQKVIGNDMRENLDMLINILNMIKTPENKADTKEAIEKIEKIKKDQLPIKLEDVIDVQRTATEAVADKLEKNKDQVQRERLLVNFEAGCRKALCRLTEEFISKQEENLSVADFLSKIHLLPLVKKLCSRHKEMLFPEYGTHADIREWDLFVYCFILEELDLSEPLENAVYIFVQEVKTIRDKLLLDTTGVTQNDLSELCKYLIDTNLNTEVTDIFKKDSPDADVIRSNNILVSWWREEEEYEKKQVSNEQLNNNIRIVKVVDKRVAESEDNIYQRIKKRLGYEAEQVPFQVPFQEAHAAVKIGAEAELRPRGIDNEKMKKALQKHSTNSNDNDTEKTKSLNNLGHKLKVSDVNLEEGSIILNVKCSSITNVIDFWNSCIDGRAVEALSDLRDYYRRHFNCDTLEFDVILTKKGVSRCVNEIVEDLPSRFEVLIDNVTHKVQEILEAKDMNPTTGPDKESTVVEEGLDPSFKSDNPASNVPMSIDIRAEEERIKEEKQIEDRPSSGLFTREPMSSGHLSEKDVISKPQLREPTTSTYGQTFGKNLKTFQTLQELSSVESDPKTASTLYTKPEKKPVN